MLKLLKILPSILFLVIFVSPFTYAFNVLITETEFRMLSDNCKKFYSVTQVGRNLGYTNKYSLTEFRAAFDDAEKAGGAWHYCAGLVYLSRAALESSEAKKIATYKRALDEISFSARKVLPDHRVYGEIHVNQAKAAYLTGDTAASRTMLEKLIAKMPTYTPAKIELARQLAKDKQLQDAIDLLLSVDPTVRDKSADLNYALGVYYFRLKNLDESSIYARKAYQLGYPLPWLKQQLRKNGITM